jgi:hypothetical protein
MEFEQRIIIEFLMKKGPDVDKILMKQELHIEEKASALGTMRFWMGKCVEERKF